MLRQHNFKFWLFYGSLEEWDLPQSKCSLLFSQYQLSQVHNCTLLLIEKQLYAGKLQDSQHLKFHSWNWIWVNFFSSSPTHCWAVVTAPTSRMGSVYRTSLHLSFDRSAANVCVWGNKLPLQLFYSFCWLFSFLVFFFFLI